MKGIIYDARTGAELQLDDMLRFGKAPPLPERADGWYSYRSGRFAPSLVALLKRHHPDEMAEGDFGCNYDDPEVWSFPRAYLTAEGLFVGAYFPRVARNCDAPD